MAEAGKTTLKRTAETALSLSEASNTTVRTSLDKTLEFPKLKSLNGDNSLNSLMSVRRSGLANLQKKFSQEMKQQHRVAFENEESPVMQPPMKRRRFQRRNSKTAAMLFSSMSSIFSEAESPKPLATFPVDADKSKSEDPWDGGLEIAEELVRQLRLRRQSFNNSVA